MTILDAAVGLREGLQPVASRSKDQQKVIALLWNIEFTRGGQKGTPALAPEPGADRQCAPLLATAIMAFQVFWVAQGEFRRADGVVDPGGRTLAKMDSLAGAPPSPPPPPQSDFIDFNGIRIRQALGDNYVSAHDGSRASILPGSAMPLTIRPLVKNVRLVEGKAEGRIHEFLFEIEKDGSTFWIGAAVPEGTSDFTRAYVYFHPATMGGDDDRTYRKFTGRWEVVQRYVSMQGIQMAAVRQQVLLVPFMTGASRSGSSATNMFASRGKDTLDAVMAAIQMQLMRKLGRTGNTQTLTRIGVASFSSGVDHLFNFANALSSTGIIREMMDFDSAYMIVAHKTMPAIAGAVSWQITQVPPPGGFRLGWLYVPPDSLNNVYSFSPDRHSQIGYLMFQTMMVQSAVQ